MKRNVMILCLVATVSACVPQQQFDDMRTAERRSQEQVIEFKSRLEEANLRSQQFEGATAQNLKVYAQLNQLESENASLRRKLADIETALQEIGPIGPLPAELDQALVQLAKSYPNLMSYDARLGMVKFSSGPTFDLGSVKIKSQAQSSLARLAEILNQPIASGYEARIVGHTDNVKISRQSTIKHHPTNWHLSVHRAIAVKDLLSRGGVPENRIGVAGYGEHRPLAPNQARGGNEMNRRVEIFLVQRVDRTADPVLGMSSDYGQPLEGAVLDVGGQEVSSFIESAE
jgi:chemotaxis protein MotB